MGRAFVIIPLMLALGCSTPDGKSNSSDNSSTDAGADTAANNVSTDGGGGGDAGGGVTCPAEAPENDAACSPTGLQCEYGTDPREGCRTRAECVDGSWLLTAPRCEDLPPVTCPATREDASGEPCDPKDAYCDYDGLVCHCTNCVEGPVGMSCDGEPTWMCAVPNPDAQCPDAKPRLGEACSMEGKQCDYKCGADGGRTCVDGTWRGSDGGPCPVSTKELKRDIRYLSAAELAEVSAAVQAIPLAHWRYTDPAYGRGEKLGFIIEDLPATTPAVDRDRLMVNLYGYTSMLLADAQAREARMRTLEARLVELEKKTAQCGD